MQVRQGPRLQAVIQGVLTVGNAVNVGTAYGNAQGIKLDSLLKLADVKVCCIHVTVKKTLLVHDAACTHVKYVSWQADVPPAEEGAHCRRKTQWYDQLRLWDREVLIPVCKLCCLTGVTKRYKSCISQAWLCWRFLCVYLNIK